MKSKSLWRWQIILGVLGVLTFLVTAFYSSGQGFGVSINAGNFTALLFGLFALLSGVSNFKKQA